MDLQQLGQFLSQTLPGLKKRFQLSGLIVGLVVIVIIQLVKPGDWIGTVIAGAIGILIIVFGQLFEYLTRFSEQSRPMVFLLTFLMFCILIVVLSGMLIFTVQAATMTVDPFVPPKDIEKTIEERSKQSLVVPDRPTLGQMASASAVETITQPAKSDAGDYKFTIDKVGDTLRLRAAFGYIANSRSGKYPSASLDSSDWGHPWIAIAVTNPSSSPLYVNELRVDIEEIKLINEVILDARVDGDYDAKSSLALSNFGWGKARDVSIELTAIREGPANKGVVVGRKSVNLEEIDQGASIPIGDLVPSDAEWGHFAKSDGCPWNRVLTVAAEVKYRNDDGASLRETFRTSITQCGPEAGAGGNILPSAYFNVDLPVETSGYPLSVATSFCVAPKSVDRIALRFTTSRSAHFRLKLTLTESTGNTLVKHVELDVPIPRTEFYGHYKTGEFFENEDKKGCT